MYVLSGGPRGGQLVDELPRGYVRDPGPDSGAEMMIGDDLFAERAVWTPPDDDWMVD